MNEKKHLLLIHGFKKHKEDIFKDLDILLREDEFINNNFEIEKLFYYDNLDKDTISHKYFESIIKDKLNELKDKEVYVIGYSLGGVVSLTLTSEYKNIKNIISLAPVYKIPSFLGWPKQVIKNYRVAKKMKKKLGPERYARLKNLQKKGVSEKYPTKIVIEINRFRLKIRKLSKRLIDKNILIIFSANDEINDLKKTINYFNKKINYEKNNLSIIFSSETHFQLINKTSTHNIDLIRSFLRDSNGEKLYNCNEKDLDKNVESSKT